MNCITNVHPLLAEVKLKQSPVIIRVNEFDEKTAGKFCMAMSAAHNSGQPVVPVIIDSYGGSYHALMTMVDAIQASTVPVATIVEGKAFSAGAMLLSYGAKGMRYAGPHSRIMVHDIAAMATGKTEELRSALNETLGNGERALDELSANCGKQKGYFTEVLKEHGHSDLFMGPEEALSHGLIDRIGLPTLRMTVDVRFDLK